ncbi:MULTISPECIES: complex I subunit 5 family protein [unclassified Fusibacter]|uniref:complex I subunit 5 family protein n=1 Tax=unclassified Fusibacter TaxID=2624464 RepID=UPI0010110198|nr:MULTISPECIES: proton-conducting transporter membrane subunit [unclassified Fusibacter]MCK8059650.1 proton-conducting membrane transporter [Fusibacter sp. A2]NPE21451.1 proton-conducting membrane transporter [Fusibacter sp. A1]RXV61862.1 proton-conducting membrane transporter [Fusibacter sp. A1]
MILPLVLMVLAPIMLGLVFFIWPNRFAKPILLSLQVVLILSVLYLFYRLGSKQEIITLLSVHKLPMGMSLRFDTLSGVLLLLNSLLFFSAVVFNIHKYYMDKLFMFLFLSLQGLINGVFLSNDLFNVYILIEVATVVVSILIMFKKDAMSMYDGMLYLLVNLAAMAFFLFGVGYIYKYFGVFDFTGVKRLIPLISDPKQLIVPYAFLLTGVSMKAAIMPLFSWLPKAHGTASAPSIVSAILSGIFVKSGVYLFIRLSILFNPILNIQEYFLWAGFFTAIAGFTFAIAQTDIKLILAYHTISQVGLIMIGINIGTEVAYQGALYHILTHGIFKGLLFMTSGVMSEIYETRRIKEMKGLWKRSKLTSIALLTAVLSITGAPFFSGAYSKAMISAGRSDNLFQIAMLIVSFGTMISFIKFHIVIFSKDEAAKPQAIAWNQGFAFVLMLALCLLFGLFGDVITHMIFRADFSFSVVKQASKILDFVVKMAISALVYKLWLSEGKHLVYFKGMELSFNNISLAIVSFFTVTVLYLNLLY